jgi:hypothetical protein
VKKEVTTKWKPGGNPLGRPLGSRSKFSEAAVADLLTDWTAHGPEVLARVRQTDPATYLRVAFTVIPKDVALTVEQTGPGNLNASLWSRLRPILDLIERHAPADADPAEVLDAVEHALRSQFAVTIASK